MEVFNALFCIVRYLPMAVANQKIKINLILNFYLHSQIAIN